MDETGSTRHWLDDPPTVGAVLVAHNGAAWLPKVLASFADMFQAPQAWRVVDVSSTDGCADLLRDSFGAERITYAPSGTGFGEAVRLGIEAMPRTDWVWLLHDDASVLPGTLAGPARRRDVRRRHRGRRAQDPRVAVAAQTAGGRADGHEHRLSRDRSRDRRARCRSARPAARRARRHQCWHAGAPRRLGRAQRVRPGASAVLRRHRLRLARGSRRLPHAHGAGRRDVPRRGEPARHPATHRGRRAALGAAARRALHAAREHVRAARLVAAHPAVRRVAPARARLPDRQGSGVRQRRAPRAAGRVPPSAPDARCPPRTLGHVEAFRPGHRHPVPAVLAAVPARVRRDPRSDHGLGQARGDRDRRSPLHPRRARTRGDRGPRGRPQPAGTAAVARHGAGAHRPVVRRRPRPVRRHLRRQPARWSPAARTRERR